MYMEGTIWMKKNINSQLKLHNLCPSLNYSQGECVKKDGTGRALGIHEQNDIHT
jgi:hypothetical protein